MPKVTKKKREKEADFKKAKLKLGKGKKAPSNATDTSFKARSIALPGQNPLNRALLAHDAGPSGETTTASGLGLDEVLIRLRHPNGGVRKEALGGVKEILAVRPNREAGKILKALGALISDDDAAVRKTLLGLLGWYFTNVPSTLLDPHLPLFLLQTSSALSHIFPEIRLDAAKLVTLLLEHVPSHVTRGWPYLRLSSDSSEVDTSKNGNTILEGLRLALGVGGDKASSSAASSRLSNGAKLVFLKSLLAFLQYAIGENNTMEGGTKVMDGIFKDWIDPAVARNRKGKGKEVDVVALANDLQSEGWLIGGNGLDDIASLDNRGEEQISRDAPSDSSTLIDLYISLHSLLLSTFLEAAPTAFSISQSSSTTSSQTEDISLQLCTTCASISEILAKPILTSQTDLSEIQQVRTHISDFLRRMAAWFPFALPKATSTPGLSPALSLSLSYAHLAVLLAPPPMDLVYPRGLRRDLGWRGRVKVVEEAWTKMRLQIQKTKRKGSKAGGNADDWALEAVSSWVTDVLSPSKDMLAPPLTPAIYSALLPIIFALIIQPPKSRKSFARKDDEEEEEEDTPTLIFTAFMQHLNRCGSTSATRAIGNTFLINLIQIHEQKYLNLPLFVSLDSPVRPLIQIWLDGIPKALWELGSKDLEASRGLLHFLLDMGLRGKGGFEKPCSLIPTSIFNTLSPKLAPYFHMTHPSRGNILGPWTKLNDKSLKKLALDVARVWIEWDDSGVLREAVGMACAGDEAWSRVWQ